MYNFHKKVNQKETLLGWYSTTRPGSSMIIDNSSLIHDYYSLEVKNPLHLVIDTNLDHLDEAAGAGASPGNGNDGNLFNIRAYVSEPMVVGEHALANMFREVKVELSLTESEIICLNQMIYRQEGAAAAPFASVNILSTPSSSVEEITSSTNHLAVLLEKISGYLQDVTEGRREADPEVGILLTDLLSGLQVLPPPCLAP
jgi:translation initiation factor 3 subunit F